MKNMSLYDFPSFSDSLPLGPSVLVLEVISQINTLRVNLASSSALRGPRLQQGTLGCMEALGLCAKSNGKPLKSWKQGLDEVYILKRFWLSVENGWGWGECHKSKHRKTILEVLCRSLGDM